jgi:serine/threonine-protein kinase
MRRGAGVSELSRVCTRCGGRYDPTAAFCPKDGAPLVAADADDPYLGKLLLGQFRIEARIGAGGMGTVYRARQEGVDRYVAIKVLHPELVQNQDAVRRFQREARVSAALDHPNVVRVILFGQLPGGDLYLVMEYLDGRSLADVVRTEGALPVGRALHIATQICDAIGEAHAQGVVHRDVKPENVLLVGRGRDADFVKVLDFGIARFLWGEQTVVTQSGLIFGTARYISPEGAAGEATDARSDVYSIAVLLYQLLCGETPFDSPSPVALLMKHLHEPVPDIRTKANGGHVPPAIAECLARALAKHPDARPDDARAFAEELREAARRAGVRVEGLRRDETARIPRGEGGREGSGPVAIGTGGLAAGASVHGGPRASLAGAARGQGVGATGGGGRRGDAATPTDDYGGGYGGGGASARRGAGAGADAAWTEDDGADEEDLEIAGLGRVGRSRRRSSGGGPPRGAVVAGAFLLGAVAVGGGALVARLMPRQGAGEVASDREALLRRASAALEAERFDRVGVPPGAPPGESVLELTDRLLGEDPHDAEALALRSAAAHKLLERADAARVAHRYADARGLYERALGLAPLEEARAGLATNAREEQLAATREDIEVHPETPVVGAVATLVGHPPLGVAPSALSRPRFRLLRAGRAVRAELAATAGGDARSFLATHTFRDAGAHEVVFVFEHEGRTVETRAEVEVAPRGRAGVAAGRGGAAAPPPLVLTAPAVLPVGPIPSSPRPATPGGAAPSNDGIDWTIPPPPGPGGGGSGAAPGGGGSGAAPGGGTVTRPVEPAGPTPAGPEPASTLPPSPPAAPPPSPPPPPPAPWTGGPV